MPALATRTLIRAAHLLLLSDLAVKALQLKTGCERSGASLLGREACTLILPCYLPCTQQDVLTLSPRRRPKLPNLGSATLKSAMVSTLQHNLLTVLVNLEDISIGFFSYF